MPLGRAVGTGKEKADASSSPDSRGCGVGCHLPAPPMARLGARSRRLAEASDDGDATPPAARRQQRQMKHQQMGTRVMAWWCARVVAPVRRACRLAVAAARARVRKAECGALNLHQDVQTCGYDDVQVMWDMLSSDRHAAGAPAPAKRKRPFWRMPPLWRCDRNAAVPVPVPC